MKTTLLTAALVFIGMATYANDTNAETTATATSAEVTKTMAPTTPNDDDYYYERKFSTITETGIVFSKSQPFFNLYQVIGARVNPYFFIGQGVGLQVTKNKLVQLQTTVDLRAYVLDKKVTPMFTVQAGVNKVSNANVDETQRLNDLQFVMNAGTGILIKARENASFTINGGYTIFTDFKNKINGGFVKVGYVF